MNDPAHTPSPATGHTTTDLAALSAAIQNWQEAAVRMGASLAAVFQPIGPATQQAATALAAMDLPRLSEYQDRAQRRWLSDYLWGPTIGRKRRQRRARGRRKGTGP